MNILWNEDGKGRFMFQMQGPTDAGVNELPTYTGQYESGLGLGWYTAFDATWAPQNFTLSAVSS